MSKTVLVLGAGLVTGPLVRYLAEKGFNVIVASRTLAKAEKLCEGLENAKPEEFDIEKEADVERLESELVPGSDAVISMLPYVFHPVAAKIAIKHKTHFLTTSYVSDAMQELDESAKANGVIMVNECGVDPGTDHMSALRVIHDVQKRGGYIDSFTSICGGLPEPSANNNPLGYKFSWAPRGVLLASLNHSTFLSDGNVLNWGSDDVFGGKLGDPVFFEEIGMECEQYPNRNSLPYIDIYNIKKTRTAVRGTFRYKGWSTTLKNLIKFGYLDKETVLENDGNNPLTYAQLTENILNKNHPNENNNNNDLSLAERVASALGADIKETAMLNFNWLGLFSDDVVPIDQGANTPLDALCSLMLSKPEMHYAENEKDMIVMQHKYTAIFDDSQEKITTTLITMGTDTASAMSRTVGLPVAIATRLVLEGKIEQTGILRPTFPELYNPILDELENDFDIVFKDKYEKVQ